MIFQLLDLMKKHHYSVILNRRIYIFLSSKTNKKQTNKQTDKKKTKDKTDIIFLYEKEGDLPLPRSKNHNPSNPKNYHDVAFLMLPELKKKVKNNKIKIRLFILLFMHLYSSSTLFTHSLPNTFFLEKFKYFSFSHEVFSPGEQKI